MTCNIFSSYEDDFEPDDDSPAPTPKDVPQERGEGLRTELLKDEGAGTAAQKKSRPGKAGDEDIYDFTPTDLGY